MTKEGNGGALHCEDSLINTLISNKFIKNEAMKGSGGSINLLLCDINIMLDNAFSYN